MCQCVPLRGRQGGNDATVSFRADQLFKIVTVDGENNPSLLDCEGIDFLVRDAVFLVVVTDVFDIKMGIEARVRCPGRHVLIIEELMFIKPFRHGMGWEG